MQTGRQAAIKARFSTKNVENMLKSVKYLVSKLEIALFFFAKIKGQAEVDFDRERKVMQGAIARNIRKQNADQMVLSSFQTSNSTF